MPKPRAARPYRTRGGRCDGRPVAARGLWRERREARSERRRTEPGKLSMFLDDEIGGTPGPWFYKKLEVLIVFLDRRLKRECAMTGDYYAGNTRKSLP